MTFFAKSWKTREHISRSSRFLVACTVAILELTLLPTLQVLLLRNLLRGSLAPPFATSAAQSSSDSQKKSFQRQLQAEALQDSYISGNTDYAATDADCAQASRTGSESGREKQQKKMSFQNLKAGEVLHEVACWYFVCNDEEVE